jgi:polar amino acid transport system substrate-binding protein
MFPFSLTPARYLQHRQRPSEDRKMSKNPAFSVARNKPRRLARLGRLALLGVAAVALTASAASATTLKEVKARGYIRIAVANEIPYGYVDPNGDAKGAGPEVATAVLGKMGIDPTNIQWVVTNFSSLIPGLQADRFDMTASEMAINPDRCKQVVYSEPDTSYGEGLLVAAGDPKGVHTYADFAKPGMKVAVMAGADQLTMLQKLGVPEDNIVTIAANADAISTVSTGRADAYAATSLTNTELASKDPKVALAGDFTDPVIDGKPARSWGAFNFSKNSATLRDAFNAELVKFKKTDAWKKILTDNGFAPADIAGSLAKTTAELCAGK